MASAEPLFRTASFSDEIEIHTMQLRARRRRARAAAARTSLAALAGLAEVDRLNVCDARDEAAHDYRFRSRVGTAPLSARRASTPTRATRTARFADGGRAILGSETFRVRTRPAATSSIVLRTAPALDANLYRAAGPRQLAMAFPEAAISVRVDGRLLGRQGFQPPRGLERRGRCASRRDHVARDRRPSRSRGRYAAFRYWFYQ